MSKIIKVVRCIQVVCYVLYLDFFLFWIKYALKEKKDNQGYKELKEHMLWLQLSLDQQILVYKNSNNHNYL